MPASITIPAPRRALLVATLLVGTTAGLVACGGNDEPTQGAAGPRTGTTADHAGHAGHAGMSDEEMQAMGHGGDGGSSAMADMAMLGERTIGGVKVSLSAMAPEAFTVPEGTKQVEHRPRAGDTVHLMATLADAESGVRLPDATVTVRVKGSAGTAFDGPLYPMIGRGMGMHYGENMPVSKAGDYTVQLVASPPKIGRHSEVKEAWTQTLRTSFALRFDGKRAVAQ